MQKDRRRLAYVLARNALEGTIEAGIRWPLECIIEGAIADQEGMR